MPRGLDWLLPERPDVLEILRAGGYSKLKLVALDLNAAMKEGDG